MEPRYPGVRDGATRISHSSLQTFLMCGLRYWKQREAKTRRATIPMAIGTAVAYAAEEDNRNKALHFLTPIRLTELQDRAEWKYRGEFEEGHVDASRHEFDRGLDAAIAATRAYWEDISPQIDRPLLFEEPVIATIGEGIDLAGTPDLIVPSIVRDLKTGQPWNQARADRSRQLTGYDLLHEARFGEPADRVAIDSIFRDAAATRKTGRAVYRGVTIWSRRTERDRLAFVETCRRATSAINAGVALPAPEGAWYCSESHCEFFETCEARP